MSDESKLRDGGGPAFPPAEKVTKAFPGREYDSRPWWPGMSLRQWFAGQALVGILAFPGNPEDAQQLDPDEAAAQAFAMADAMLAEGNK